MVDNIDRLRIRHNVRIRARITYMYTCDEVNNELRSKYLFTPFLPPCLSSVLHSAAINNIN